ncbi:hypothetical protein AAFF_G00434780 [Aldrovandia affinis]|uniref:Uncharacterized protein n=1 Tax=Aldrovandia affinis TaxID=143900 RepID=A0AAD7S8C7_9TELE|nr:hypothetical protein AAFF_G00434780 [Aldrovandia affinis]
MGCQCCRMLKSYIYDPSVPVDVQGRKWDTSSSSLYQRKPLEADNLRRVQGFHNLGYSHKYAEGLKNGAAKLEIDNNQINRLHAAPGNGSQDHALKPGAGDSPLYILQPGDGPIKCIMLQNSAPCRPLDKLEGHLVAGGGENGDVNTSTTSLSSADTKERAQAGDGGLPGASATDSSSSEGEEEEEEGKREEDDCGSVTDSEVAEALAALEAATAGEDYE